jgi:hypothetical protein
MAALATIQLIDVHVPAVDGRWLIVPGYTQPEAEARLVLDKLRLSLPDTSFSTTQPPLSPFRLHRGSGVSLFSRAAEG